MKLVTYDSGSGPAACVLADDRVIDVASLLAHNAPLRDVQALLELPNEPLNRVRDQLAKGGARGMPPRDGPTPRTGAAATDRPDFMIYEGTQRRRHAQTGRRVVSHADLLLLQHAPHLWARGRGAGAFGK